MRLETEHAYAILNDGVGECSLSAKKASGDDNAVVLEELAVYSSKEFGGGYGKSLLTKILSEVKTGLIIVPIGVYLDQEDSLFVGRIKVSSYNDLLSGMDLLKKFYISCIEKSGREYKILKTEGDIEFIYVSPFSF